MRLTRLAAAVVAIALVGLVWKLQAGAAPLASGAGPVEAAVTDASPSAQRANLDSRDDLALDRRPANYVNLQVPAIEGDVEAAPEEAPGTVTGMIYGTEGEVIPKGRVLFEIPSSRPHVTQWTAADAYGNYSIVLDAGVWQVYCAGNKGGSGPSLVCVGEVRVAPRQEVLFDVALFGDVTFEGGVFCPDRENILLEAELYFSTDPTQLVAKAFCVTDDKAYAAHLARTDQPNPRRDHALPSQPPGLGPFRFEGLAPELYELRVFMDAEHRFYATFQIDLTNGSKSFDPLPVTEEEFLRHAVFAGL